MSSLDKIRDIVTLIMEEADEIRSRENRSEMEFGELLAYAEALCIIRDVCHPDDLAKIGLDFDIDAKYLL